MALAGAGRLMFKGWLANTQYLPSWGYSPGAVITAVAPPFSAIDIVEHTLKATRISEDKMEVNDVTDS